MKFKTGFVLGAAAGVWAVRKAERLSGGAGKKRPFAPEEASDKLRALSGLAKERLTDLVEGPVGAMARERVTELIGTSLSGPTSGRRSGPTSRSGPAVDVSAR